MSLAHDQGTFGRARLSFANEAEIDEFVATLEQVRARRDHARPMARVPAGSGHVRSAAGRRRADAAGEDSAGRADAPISSTSSPTIGERYSRGFGHITTRQNIQFHFVKLHDVEPAMRLLAEAGMTTREACGNSVRNITACPYAGVAADERFDVTPYAEAMTRYLLRQPLSSTLPRKFKIAFEGCPVDHALTGHQRLGFYAAARAGRRPRDSASRPAAARRSCASRRR